MEVRASPEVEPLAKMWQTFFPSSSSSSPPCAVSDANMSEKKAVIKNADMSEDMQQDAVDLATQAMEKFNIEKDIAAYVKKVRPRLQVGTLCGS